MHKVLLRIDKDIYDKIQRWCYSEKAEGRQMSFQKFFVECISDGMVKKNIV